MVAATVTQYRKEFIGTFEQNVSILRHMATKEHVMNGNIATFLVAGSGGATAVTRGDNGQIPYGAASNTQVSATLAEKHAPFELTGFNIFASQGDQNKIMRKASMSVINRDIDLTILAMLDTYTNDTGASATMSLALVMHALAILGRNDVDIADAENLFGVLSPSAMAYLMQTTEFASHDYVDFKPFVGPARKVLRWAGVNWHISNLVTGVGTATEDLYIFHRDAIGYAVNVGEDKLHIGYDDKQDVSWSRATIYHGAAKLQNGGVVNVNHDGSAHVAS